MDDTHRKGHIAEEVVKSEFAKEGITTLEPTSKEPYDLAVEVGDGFQKVQVKSSSMSDGSIVAHLRRTNMTSDGPSDSHYTSDEVDYYAIYSPELDKVYVVPFEDAAKTRITLRVKDDVSACARHSVNWASEYELSIGQFG